MTTTPAGLPEGSWRGGRMVVAWRAGQVANDAVDNHPLPNGDVVMPGLNPTTEPSALLIEDSGHTDHPIF